MNTVSFETRSATPVQLQPAAASSAATTTRHVRRERDFGVGYGNSQGYASQRRYASNWVQPRFRFA